MFSNLVYFVIILFTVILEFYFTSLFLVSAAISFIRSPLNYIQQIRQRAFGGESPVFHCKYLRHLYKKIQLWRRLRHRHYLSNYKKMRIFSPQPSTNHYSLSVLLRTILYQSYTLLTALTSHQLVIDPTSYANYKFSLNSYWALEHVMSIGRWWEVSLKGWKVHSSPLILRLLTIISPICWSNGKSHVPHYYTIHSCYKTLPNFRCALMFV